MKSNFVMQVAKGSFCPDCLKTVTLLCKRNDPFMDPAFYICFPCNKVGHVGKGPVEMEA